MKNKKVAEKYDDLYSKDKTAFSGEPLPIVKALAEQLRTGSVLEVGAGAGRNSLYLAAWGLDVLATDISSASIALIEQRAQEGTIKLRTKVMDVTESDLTDMYDAVVCTFTLHHLERSDALQVLKSLQAHTKPGGYHALTAFTKDGAFYKSNPTAPYFFLENKEELEQLYAGWKILKIFEKEGEAREPDAEGGKQFNVFAGLLAQKVA